MKQNFVKTIIAAVMMSAFALTASAQNVTKNADGTVTYTYADGSSKTFAPKKLSELTSEERQSIIAGEKAAYDTKVVGLDGKNRRRSMLEIKGGAHLTDGNIAPMGNVAFTYDILPNLAAIGEVEISSNRYGDNANRTGSYIVGGGFAGVEYFPVVSALARYTGEGSRFGFGAKGGFLKGQTVDLSDEKAAGSEGFAGALKVYLKGQIRLSKRLYGVIEGGVRWGGHFQTDEGGNWKQEFLDKSTGGYLEAGIGIKL